MVYTCSIHQVAKLEQHHEWSATKFQAAKKLNDRVNTVESVCPDCIAAAKKSMNALMEKRYGRHLQSVS